MNDFKDFFKTALIGIAGLAGILTIIYLADGIPEWKYSLAITFVFAVLYKRINKTKEEE